MLHLLTRKKSRKLRLCCLPIMGSRNWHYEVVSHDIFDREGNFYYSLEEAQKAGQSQEDLLVSESILSENHLLVYRYVENEDDAINITKASKCHLGVLRYLQGKYKGVEFMFSLYDDQEEISIQMMAYGYLTYGVIDRKLLKLVKANPYYLSVLHMSVGTELYEDILRCESFV